MSGTEHVPALISAAAPLVKHWGYWAVAGLLFLEDFGMPVPGETVLVAAALYAGLGQLNIFAVMMTGIIAASIGDNVGFLIGHYGGHPLAERYGRYVFLTPKRIDAAMKFFRRYGGRVVAVARFIDGLRQLNGIIAGMGEMVWKRFVAFNFLGAILWVGFWSVIGYYGGGYINLLLHGQLYLTLSVLLGLTVLAAYKIWHKRTIR